MHCLRQSLCLAAYRVWRSSTRVVTSMLHLGTSAMSGLTTAVVNNSNHHDTWIQLVYMQRRSQSIQYSLHPSGKIQAHTARYRLALANLLKSRLNPYAIPFVPARKNLQHKRWDYEVDPATKQLLLPVKYKFSQLKVRSARLHFKVKSIPTVASVKMKPTVKLSHPILCATPSLPGQ